MSKKTIRIVVLLAGLSILGLAITQVFWVNKAVNVEQDQFEARVTIALRSLATRILDRNQADPNQMVAIDQLSSNSFLVQLNTRIDERVLDSLLIFEFRYHQIDMDYEYGVYNCFDDRLLYGNYKRPTELKGLRACAVSESDSDCHNFVVTFPTKMNYIVSHMGTWVFSSIALLIVLAFFIFTLMFIWKEKRLSEIKADFINNMTHEFKTPLSTISLSSEVLSKPDIIKSPDRLSHYAKIIYDENQRLTKQVDRVLQIAVLSKGDIKLKKKELDLHRVIEKAVQSLSLLVTQREGSIDIQLNAKDHVILADRVHVTNIITNLLDNANKYSAAAPQIAVSTKNKRNGILVSVADKGIGMSEEAQQQIFKQFYRVPTGNIHDVKGFGLGLFYAKLMVQAHKGYIGLKSELNRGSKFDVFFPFA